jgi:predicted enzyme related to lactoylglutathione lyase
MASKHAKKAASESTKKKFAGRPAAKAAPARKARASRGGGDAPVLFRLNVEVGNLDRAALFYGELFGSGGQRHAGSRLYLACGSVTLQIVDVSASGPPHAAAKALYFTVKNLDAVFARAQKLRCLSKELVHGEPGGAITVRPWGERSFYAEDPWGNPLCFVEAGTTYA